MKQLQCPKCGATFTVDENDYNEIVKQVRDAEFKTAMQERETTITTQMKLEAAQERALLEKENQEKLDKLKAEIMQLKGDLKTKETANDLAIKNAVAEKELDISKLENQIQMSKKELALEVAKVKDEYEFKLQHS